MEVDEQLVSFIVTTYYNITPIFGSIQPLCGYSDKNFSLIDSNDNKKYVLKIVNPNESDQNLTGKFAYDQTKQQIEIIDEIVDNAREFCATDSSLQIVVPKPIRTSANKLSVFTSVKYHRNGQHDDNQVDMVQCNLKMSDYFVGTTMFEYINKHFNHYKPAELYFQLGKVCNQLFRFMRTQRHLQDRLKQVRHDNSWPWRLLPDSDALIEKNLELLYPSNLNGGPASKRRDMVEQVLRKFRDIKSQLNQLPEFIFHSDLCNRNIMINPEQSEKFCLIDFQDIQVGNQVAELAILMLYSVLEQERLPFEEALKWIPHWILLGYQSSPASTSTSSYSLTSDELDYAPVLMKLRLCQSLLNGQLAYQEDPKNEYVMHTNQRGWQLLELMTTKNEPFYGDAHSIDKQLAIWWLIGPTTPNQLKHIE